MFVKIAFVIYALNFIFLLKMVFVEKRKYKQTIVWYIVLNFLPILGIFLYIIFGGGLDVKTKIAIKNKKHYTENYYKHLDINLPNDISNKKDLSLYQNEIVSFVENNFKNMFSCNNCVKVFTSGIEKINALKKDLLGAKKSINILYYIFANDCVGKEIMSILCQKAKQGVKIKLIYDSIGSRKTPQKFFKKLQMYGGEVAEFFPPLLKIKYFNSKINYRNHRKIVVIDGNIAYTGGINIRDDHMGKNKKLSPWRDTSIKLKGKIVWDLQNVFINDWLFCKKNANFIQFTNANYFSKQCLKTQRNIGAQVLQSGPETKINQIYDAYLKMFCSAKKYIYIQTPYLIPDENLFKSLEIAKKSGVDIKIMLPQKPDKKSVYDVSLAFAKQLAMIGVEIYVYKGFLHAKTVVVDDVVSIGTCNIDNRSFMLNFEVCVLLYGQKIANKNKNIFYSDLDNCIKLTNKYFAELPVSKKIAQGFYKLFSPIL